jgi:hypothetical protein
MSDMNRSGLTRRRFLQGMGYSAAAAALIDVSATMGFGTALGPGANQAFAAASGSIRFGSMFPKLPPFKPDADPNTTVNNLATLALSMSSSTNAGNPNGTGAIYTYWGQFIDHNLTRDLTPLPFDPVNGVAFHFVDPNTVTNQESFVFNLNNLYNTSPPSGTGAVFAPDGVRLVVQNPNPNGVPDVPRNSSGIALIGDPRNDENELTLQVHLAFMFFHNAVVDALKITDLATAKATVSKYYQWAVLNDFLPTICGPTVPAGILDGSIKNPYSGSPTITPIEWDNSAYRLHNMVRSAYEMNITANGGHPIFNGTDDDLHGGRQLPAANQIDFGNFVNALAGSSNVINQFNEFAPLMAGPASATASPTTEDSGGGTALYELPIGSDPGSIPIGLNTEPTGSDILAFRDLIRVFSYGNPSGQDVAAALGVPVISPTDAIDSTAVPGFTSGTPLWYYLLVEAQQNNPQFVGPSAARIIAGVFIERMKADPNGILNPANTKFAPEPPIAPTKGEFGIADLITFAGLAANGSA